MAPTAQGPPKKKRRISMVETMPEDTTQIRDTYPRLLIAVSLTGNLDQEELGSWLRNLRHDRPDTVAFPRIRIDFSAPSNSALVVLNLPLLYWTLLPSHPAYRLIGVIKGSTSQHRADRPTVSISDEVGTYGEPVGPKRRSWDKATHKGATPRLRGVICKVISLLSFGRAVPTNKLVRSDPSFAFEYALWYRSQKFEQKLPGLPGPSSMTAIEETGFADSVYHTVGKFKRLRGGQAQAPADTAAKNQRVGYAPPTPSPS